MNGIENIIQFYPLAVMIALILGPPLFKRSIKGFSMGPFVAVCFMTSFTMVFVVVVLWTFLMLHCHFSIKKVYSYLDNKYGYHE